LRKPLAKLSATLGSLFSQGKAVTANKMPISEKNIPNKDEKSRKFTLREAS
jgi:hypothetical protein